jgi:hypothetical protein
MQNLTVAINLHCGNNYHVQSVITNRNSRSQLESCLEDSGYSSLVYSPTAVAEIPPLLLNPCSRIAAIRQLIMAITLSHPHWTCDPSVSLLPPSIAIFCSSIIPVQGSPGFDHGMYSNCGS